MASALVKIEALQNQVVNIASRLELIEQEVQLAEVTDTAKRLAVLQDRTDQLATAAVKIATFEVRVAELERCKQEADKRQWQFVYITLGVVGSLLSGLVVQLLLWALKK